MRLVIQRVRKASVSVDKNLVGEIGQGLFVLVGVGKGDTQKDAENLAGKLLKLRIMSDSSQKMNLSVSDTKGGILVISQFTLFADTHAGNRPSFISAAPPGKAKEIYDYFISVLKTSGLKISCGEFGAYMKIEAVLDGPVTILI